MTVTILVGDVRDKLGELPDESVHCVVTSPPFWGLRDYGVAGQIGLEPDFRDYISTMVMVFREVRRVLRQDGTVWLNLGDSYANDGKWGGSTGGKHVTALHGQPVGRARRQTRLKPKDLVGIPWRVAIALQDDGWWLRQDIIWAKPNPMPESVIDRCTKAHEYLFLLSKSARYYFDAAAIRERASDDAGPGVGGWTVGEDHTAVGHNVADREESHGTRYKRPNSPGSIKSPHGQGFTRRARGMTPRHALHPNTCDQSGLDEVGRLRDGEGFSRNKRSVWTIATTPFKEAHFATFPPALVEPCILAGCPQDGTVLDPFFGAGTTGLVADRLGRHCIGIELSPTYAEMARKRIAGDAGPFLADVVVG